MTQSPAVSIVIPTHNEGLDVLATVDCILRNSGVVPIQLIVVDDRSVDVSADALRRLAAQGLIELVIPIQAGAVAARNAGAKQARAAIIGFIDAHCYTPKNWLEPLLAEFERRPETAALSPVISCTDHLLNKGYGATWVSDELTMSWLPETATTAEVPFIGGAATFVRRAIFEQLSGFDDGIVEWGCEDVELSIRLWLSGYKVVVVPQSTIYHKFRKHYRYTINSTDLLYNKMRMIFVHFDGHRLRRLLRHQLQYPQAEVALQRLYHDGSEARRDYLRKHSALTMDEFCDRFQLVC